MHASASQLYPTSFRSAGGGRFQNGVIGRILHNMTLLRFCLLFALFALAGTSLVYLTVGPPKSLISASHIAANKKMRGIDDEYDSHENEELERKSCCRGHMVLVPGHGVYRGADFNDILSESSWALEKFQFGRQHPQSIVAHISKAIDIVAADPTATLIFSGGQSRPDCVARSEGATYLDLVFHNVNKVPGFAKAKAFVDNMTRKERVIKVGRAKESRNVAGKEEEEEEEEQLVPRRMLAEEFARDSYENLIFSVCRYFEYFGIFPDKITVVGFPHKYERFMNYHRVAMKWPASKMSYIGIKAEKAPTQSDAAAVVRAARDPYLCKENRRTRVERNPNRLVPPYALSVPASVRSLLRYCGLRTFNGYLPWSANG